MQRATRLGLFVGVVAGVAFALVRRSRAATDRLSAGGEGFDGRLDERLDEGLAESFPASDPVAVNPVA
jgi:hypothetical protein